MYMSIFSIAEISIQFLPPDLYIVLKLFFLVPYSTERVVHLLWHLMRPIYHSNILEQTKLQSYFHAGMTMFYL